MPLPVWRPSDVNRLIAVGTMCFCILMVVAIAMIGLCTGLLDIKSFGQISKGGFGTGILAMLVMLVLAVTRMVGAK